MQFADVLASTIHDIKNSLGMVMATLDELSSDPANKFAHPEKVIQLQQEAKRANNDLIQLLMIYKHENGRLGLNVNEQIVEDFLDDILIENRALLKARGIELRMECDSDLSGYFDDDLIRGVINNTIGNASRYTKSEILLTADEEDGYLVLRVEDDGPGYPAEMLEKQASDQEHGGFSSGHTKLGLFFSSLVASIHENRGRKGLIRMENGHALSGGCFSILLP